MTKIPNLLTVAGSDPSGGAGIQGDLRTFAALGAYGCGVVTALTAQNTRGIRGVLPVPADFVTRQLDTLLEDVAIDAVKIGMLGGESTVRAVARVMRRHPRIPIVLDPVMRASMGAALLAPSALAALRDRLIPLATVITPNTLEAGSLLEEAPATCVEQAVLAARRLVELGARAALVTGGHLTGSADVVDVLAVGSEVTLFRTPRMSGGTHGTGCALSSAITTLLAFGRSLPQACAESQRFVAGAIRGSRDLAVGHGVGPVNALA